MVPNDLQTAVADALGLPKQSVQHVARRLREAGVTDTGGRGRSAKKPVVRDAACLLLAIVGGEESKKAPDIVRCYQESRIAITGEAAFFDFVDPAASGAEALEAIMTAFVSGDMQMRLGRYGVAEEELWQSINLQFLIGPAPEMNLYAGVGQAFAAISCEPYGPRRAGGMTRHQLVSFDILSQIANSLAGRRK